MLRPAIPVQEGSATNSYDFDINNDSSIDLTFQLVVEKYYLPEWNQYQIIITESMNPNGTLYFINEADNCMKVLNQHDTIDMNQYWTPYPNFGSIISGQSYYGQNKNKDLDCNSINSNKYCGIKLYNNGNIFYGWVRLSWSGSYVKVHDFAYNATPDMMILAGQTESTGLNNNEATDPFTITLRNGNIEITSEGTDNKINRVRIINFSGQCIQEIDINNYKASINTSSITPGFYII